MNRHPLLDASSRVALAAYLHDLGKFAERAAIEQANERADDIGNTVRDLHRQEYCPKYNNRYSHIHAAYTAIAMTVIEKHLPDIKAGDCFPFASWANPEQLREGDSLINAAARHHKPETFLQWVVATADRMASGFERSEFEEYNRAEEGNAHRSYVTARMEVLLEKISLADNSKAIKRDHRYALKPLSPRALMPIEQQKAEPSSDEEGRKQYRALWDQFIDALAKSDGTDAIPKSHKKDLSLWLDHFDSLWLTFTHCIPSATAAKVDGKFIDIPADVSLYDHSKTAAALAVAIWRWHHHQKQLDNPALVNLRDGNDSATPKVLMIQGDMFGIQDFIFQSGGSVSKYASKLLRGRSFYVSLLAECAALRVLDTLGLPPTSQITNAAGKFLIVAPNTPDVIESLSQLRREFDEWAIRKSYGRIGLGLAWTEASANNFLKGKKSEESPFAALMKKLFAELETQKYQRLQLWSPETPSVFSSYLAETSEGVCEIDGVSPVSESDEHDSNIKLGSLAQDHITIGKSLARRKRIVVTRNKLSGSAIKNDLFGLHVHFVDEEDQSGMFSAQVTSGNLLRCWDFALPALNGDAPLWNGYARRYINAYVAPITLEDLHNRETGKYKEKDADELDTVVEANKPKTFNLLASDDRIYVTSLNTPGSQGNWVGIAALHAIKGDVDNLGAIFQQGLEQPTFAKMAAMSRQVNAFFAIYLPWLCASESQYQNTYTVFAGGDDFFLIGPWRSQMQLALAMREKFKEYVAYNPSITFSAGLYQTKPGLPIRQLSEGAEAALDNAKAFGKEGDQTALKNAISCFGHTMSWETFRELFNQSAWLENQATRLGLSTGYIYSLLELAAMASDKNTPQSAIWRSRLTYRTTRWISDKRKRVDGESTEQHQQRVKEETSNLLGKLANELTKYGTQYHLPLTTFLYTHRD